MFSTKRDVSGESSLNFIFRFIRASSRRIRGFIYYRLFVFSNNSSSPIFIDRGARIYNSKQIRLNSYVAFGINIRLEVHNQFPSTEVKLSVGSSTSFGDNCHVGAFLSIVIGDSVLIGSNVLIIDHNHGNTKEELMRKLILAPRHRELVGESIVIEDNVWIGDGVVILPGSHIEEGAVIAANTVVRGLVKKRQVYTGIKR